jgi:CheY-like chemotaxis protein
VKASPKSSRILVASDNIDDARLITRQLEGVFDDVRASTTPGSEVADFEACKPQVLVLGFGTLEKSERYYLGLYRQSAEAVQGAHRTVVLCGKDDVKAAYELCKRDYFDDYVLFWPQSYDGTRLAMSVWNACRQTTAFEDHRPGNAELLLHAKHLAELERVVAEPDAANDGELRSRLRPALEGTRSLAAAVQSLKPVVLVIDDDAFAQELVLQALDAEKWDVVFAADARSALAQLGRTRIDVILMDIRLPGIDGLTLTRQLKSAPATAAIPIIMLTGDARRETLMSSVEAGAAGFVVKPVTRATLKAKLDLVLPR